MKFVYSETKRIAGSHRLIKGDGLTHDLVDRSCFSLMTGCDYLGIDINAENRVYGISGYVSIKNLKKAHILVPKEIIDGALLLINSDPIPGMVEDYTYPLIGQYDSKQKCICLGDFQCKATPIRISDDVIISLHDNNIVAIFIKPIIL